MPTRRSLLKRGTELTVLAGLSALAGCTDALPGSSGGDGGDGGSGGGDAPGYASAMYDPSTMVDAANVAFFSYDLGAMYGMRDRLPDRFTRQLEAAGAMAEGFDPAELDRVTGVMGGSVAQDGSDVGEAVGSVRVTGSFDTEALAKQLQSAGNAEVSKAKTHGGVDLYTGETGMNGAAASVGLGAEALYAGGTTVPDMTSTKPVERMIDAASGDAKRYYANSDVGSRLLDELSGSLSVTGVEVDAELLQRQMTTDGNSQASAAVSGLQGMGASTTIEGDTATSELEFLYADGEAPAKDTVDALASAATQRQDLAQRFGDLSVDRSGSRVTLSASQSTRTLFERPDEALTLLTPGIAVTGAFFLGVGSRVETNVQAGATVEFDDDADEVRVAYTSTTAEETTLTAVAEPASGGDAKVAELRSVGDSERFSFPDGTTVTVRVVARQRDRSTVILEKTDTL